MVAETAAEVALLETKAAREHAHGLDTRMIDGDAARAIIPWLSPASSLPAMPPMKAMPIRAPSPPPSPAPPPLPVPMCKPMSAPSPSPPAPAAST